ncbi:MAG: N-acetyl-gamma-glutamyl-phosphate reductase [Thaumarchaeota archaeon]|nr:N-acetyl-gamma-glutamyl-phosphate reductase [Nitrososphaerota archaeon]
MKIGVIGGSGYVGGELLRLLLRHPNAEISSVTSKKYSGEFLHRVHANLRGATEMKFMDHDVEKVASTSELVFTSVPHGMSMKVIPRLLSGGIKVIDMAADFRLKDPKDYLTWYGKEHPFPDLLGKSVYGVPELYRDEIRKASLVSAPGCMAVTSILALSPLVKNKVIDNKRIIVDAKIGSSGAGVNPTASTHHAERSGVVRPYKPVGHRHTGEIEQELSRLQGEKVTVSMSPHAVNIVRGILCTSHVFPTNSISVPEMWKIYRGFYKDEPFIRYVRDHHGLYRYPDPKIVIGSNYCDIGFEIDERGGRIVIMSAIDNLMKGAAGSGIQAFNTMLRVDERTGLEAIGLHPA